MLMNILNILIPRQSLFLDSILIQKVMHLAALAFDTIH